MEPSQEGSCTEPSQEGTSKVYPRQCLGIQSLNGSGLYDSSSAKAGGVVANHLATARILPKEARTITGGRAANRHHWTIRGGENLLTYTATSHQ
ncbi:hypothetical protein AVEN_194023-1 [Araneus ventricosus]|uniref:Uncharacterized protein n=1 Tax=Araneus ventricosus TaxID=182803 RepID=A0A4Y2UJJ2_ARAVE|nr:hypothetical protein AVEN_194023-1 [Araneus ventricosus]